MKQKHHKTLKLIFHRPVSGGIKWIDIEAMFVALGTEVSEREGSRVAVFLFRVRSQAFENGWKVMELHHEHYDI